MWDPWAKRVTNGVHLVPISNSYLDLLPSDFFNMISALTYFTELFLINLFYFVRIYKQIEIYIRQLRFFFVLEMHHLANMLAINMLILLLLALVLIFFIYVYILLPPGVFALAHVY